MKNCISIVIKNNEIVMKIKDEATQKEILEGYKKENNRNKKNTQRERFPFIYNR